MEVVSLCPIRTSSLQWQPSGGGRSLSVICKATFELRPERATLAELQEYPNDDDNHWDDDPARSLYSPSDLVPFKPRADVLLVGHAFSPNRDPATSLVARLATSGVDKAIQVFGERFWQPDGSARDGLAFSRMPLRYDRAAGGPDTNNPVGLRLDGETLPNLQPVGVVARQGEPMDPAGFGPIAPSWPTRLAKLGPHADSWRRGTLLLRPLPEDLDASFFNSAPPDQQVDRIPDTAAILLENLSAQHPRLQTSLPGMRPRAFVARRGRRIEEVLLKCDTLWIDTDRSLCTLVWRGQVQLLPGADHGKVNVLLEDAKRPLAWPDIERECADEIEAHDTETVYLPADGVLRAGPSDVDSGLPFVAARASGPPSAPGRVADAAPKSRADVAGSSAVLPFAAPAPAPAPPPLMTPTPPMMPPAPPTQPQPPPPPMVSRLMQSPASVVLPSPQPPVAASASAFAASNAAASAAASRPPTARPSTPEPAARAPAPSQVVVDVVDLLWFDPPACDRVRKNPPWEALLASLKPKPPRKRFDPDDPPPEEPQETKDERDIFAVMTELESATEQSLDEIMGRAVSPLGAFKPPLAVIWGELQFPFDELETLKATIATVGPIAGADKKLKETVDLVTEQLATPWLEGSRAVAESLTARLREAWTPNSRAFPQGYVDAQVERRLLEQRHYQRRTLLGKPWIRALLTPNGSQVQIPTYIPATLAETLPLYRRFKARLVAEVLLQQDQQEAHPLALRTLALARVTPIKATR